MRTRDPRHYQIAVLASLLVYGIGWLDLEITPTHGAVVLATALLAQYAATRIWRLPAFDPRSALISGLSLCLLLRAETWTLAAAAAFVTIAGKFVIRWRGKHLFNPTNFGLVVMILLTGRVWVSPGQWGSGAFLGFLLACLGGLVVNRAARSDVTWAFLGFYLMMILGRAAWLGDPPAIPLHQLQSGALLLFGFFMISDPKTTPDSRPGRILFAFLVALGGFLIQYGLYRPNGILYSLALAGCLVPVLDRLWPAGRYRWEGGGTGRNRIVQGGTHEKSVPAFVSFSGVDRLDSIPVRLLRVLRRQGGHPAVQPGIPGRSGS